MFIFSYPNEKLFCVPFIFTLRSAKWLTKVWNSEIMNQIIHKEISNEKAQIIKFHSNEWLCINRNKCACCLFVGNQLNMISRQVKRIGIVIENTQKLEYKMGSSLSLNLYVYILFLNFTFFGMENYSWRLFPKSFD